MATDLVGNWLCLPRASNRFSPRGAGQASTEPLSFRNALPLKASPSQTAAHSCTDCQSNWQLPMCMDCEPAASSSLRLAMARASSGCSLASSSSSRCCEMPCPDRALAEYAALSPGLKACQNLPKPSFCHTSSVHKLAGHWQIASCP